MGTSPELTSPQTGLRSIAATTKTTKQRPKVIVAETEATLASRPSAATVALMPLPTAVKEAATAQVARYCVAKIPAEHADEIRIEYKLRGNALTIYESRPPWRKDLGPNWTSMRICVFEWDPATRHWTLYASDRNDRRLDYPYIDPSPELLPLLDELDSDPTGIFWG